MSQVTQAREERRETSVLERKPPVKGQRETEAAWYVQAQSAREKNE